MKKCIMCLFVLITISLYLNGQVEFLDNSRKGLWHQAGYLRFIEQAMYYNKIINVLETFPTIDNSGSSDVSWIFPDVFNMCDPDSLTIIYFPPGTYKCTDNISISSGNVIIKGAGADQTSLIFSFNDGNKNCIELLGTAGSSLGEGGNPISSDAEPIMNVGIEDLLIKKDDGLVSPGVFGHNIYMSFARNCWVRGIESFYASKFHIETRYCENIEIRDSYIHNAYSYDGGGNGYGVCLTRHSSKCLIENNIFKRLRHAMLCQYDAFDNVFGYNYSEEPRIRQVNEWGIVFYTDSIADMCLHGYESQYPSMWGNPSGPPIRNLFESNIGRFMHSDDAHMGNGEYNTFFRNIADGYGLALRSVCNDHNVIGNEVDNNGDYGHLYPDPWIINGQGHYTYSNKIEGSLPQESPGDMSLYYDYSETGFNNNNRPVFFAPYSSSIPYWPSIGKVEGEHNGNGTIPAKLRWQDGTSQKFITAGFEVYEMIPMIAAFSVSDTAGFPPLQVQFADNSTRSPTSWSWDFNNDGVIDSNDRNPVFTYQNKGSFSVKLTAANANQSNTVVYQDLIHVWNLPPHLETWSPLDTVIIVQQTAEITFGIEAYDTDSELQYSWSINSQPVSGQSSSNTIAFNEVGVFVVSALGQDEEYHVVRDWQITVEPQLVANFVASDSAGYAPFMVQFTDLTTQNPHTWRWDLDGDNAYDSYEQNPSFTYTEKGSYDVKLIAIGALGLDVITKEEYITVLNVPPVIQGHIPADTFVVAGPDSTITFSLSSYDPDSELSYRWVLDGVALDDTLSNIDMQIIQYGGHILTGTVLDEEYEKTVIWNIDIDGVIINPEPGWYAGSIPVNLHNNSLHISIPQIESVSSYNAGSHSWEAADSLEVGKGYWIRITDSVSVVLRGSPAQETLTFQAGWNFVGSFYVDQLILLSAYPQVLSVFLVENGYTLVQQKYLLPGKAYWVQVSEDFVLNLEENNLRGNMEVK